MVFYVITSHMDTRNWRVLPRVLHWKVVFFPSHLQVIRRKRLSTWYLSIHLGILLRVLFPVGVATWRFPSIPHYFIIYSEAKTFIAFFPSSFSSFYLWILSFPIGSGMFGNSEPYMIIAITLFYVHIYHRGHGKCLRADFWDPLNTILFISELSCFVT